MKIVGLIKSQSEEGRFVFKTEPPMDEQTLECLTEHLAGSDIPAPWTEGECLVFPQLLNERQSKLLIQQLASAHKQAKAAADAASSAFTRRLEEQAKALGVPLSDD